MRKLRPSGGYRKLRTFQTATIIYDATVWFCERFIDPRSRTVDQMVQAARSGRQNIAAGSRAAATSSQTELRLVNVARASQEELLLDYEDYLRHRHREQWTADCPEAAAVRAVPEEVRRDQRDRSDLSDLTDQERWAPYARWLEHDDGAVRANALVCLINQTNYLLDQQIAALEAHFVGEGGYTEQLATARLAERGRQRSQTPTSALNDPPTPSHQRDRSNQSDPTDRKSAKANPIPACPDCGKLMVLRTAKQGKNRGRSFWGCSGHPECKGVATS